MQGLLTLQPMVSVSKAARSSSKTAGTLLLEKAWDDKPPPAPLFQLRTNRVPTAMQLERPSNFQMQPQTLTYKQTSDPRFCEGEVMTDRIYINNCRSDEESTSVSLSAMVDGFIEGECEIRKCGRARCTCGDGTNNEGGCLFDTRDGKRFSETLPDALEALILSIGNAEQTLLDTVRILMRKVKETACICGATNWSNGCLKWSLMNELRILGYNAAICKSKWDPAAGYPGGVYEYLDVVTTISMNTQKKERVIVDIEFLEHFDIARPTRRYRATLNTLPSIFVGRPDNLQKIVTIMCDAAKRSLNEREMHLPPWRKSEYMEAKWFSTYSRISNESDHLYETQTKYSTVFAARELNTHPRLIESEVTYGLAETMTARRGLRKSETENCKKWIGHRFEDYETKNSSRNLYTTLGGTYELTVVSTDWEPPPVQPKVSQRFRKVAGLAAVLGKAEASVQGKEHKNVASALILPEKCREDLSSAEMWSKAKPRNMHTRRTWMHSNVDLLRRL